MFVSSEKIFYIQFFLFLFLLSMIGQGLNYCFVKRIKKGPEEI